MSNRKRLVCEHLENLSGRILEEYPDVIRDLIRRRSGIYALYRRDRIYYVGLASNLMGRLRQHMRDRHRGAWDRFSVYLTIHDEHMKELESLILRILAPIGNRQKGKFAGSTNLRTTVNQLLLEEDADRRAKLLGGHVAERRRRHKARSAKGKLALAGLIERSMVLRGERDGWEYRATLRKDGTIRYGDEVFETPNAAARGALKKPASGWRFWKYKDKDGEWVVLGNLKS